MAQKKDSGQLYAIKTIKKQKIVDKNNFELIENGKFILGLNSDKYIVNIFYTFQGTQHLYFVMEYLSNGDLGTLLESKGRFEANQAAFYIAEVILCLEFLH